MKVCTVVGTRPEIIRLSKIITTLDDVVDHVFIHTGQNYDPALSDVFFNELGLRAADEHLDVHSSQPGEQIGLILSRFETAIKKHRPDKLLILGDTNSALTAIIAKKYGVSVYHMEAGNRCFDERVPEELNRRLVDHASDILMPYTRNSKENLVREGISLKRIFVVGNPIKEVLTEKMPAIEQSTILAQLGLQKQEYFLATCHRAENVDSPDRLSQIIKALSKLSDRYQKKVIFSTHPRTRSKLTTEQLNSTGLVFVDPLSFFNFVHLELNAALVLTDSGTVQEECSILGIPSVTLRDSTERPETIEAGSSIFAGTDPASIALASSYALKADRNWNRIEEYERLNVSSTVVKVLLSQEVN